MMKIVVLKLQRNLQILMSEVYKTIKGEAPAIMKNVFFFSGKRS